MKLTVGSLVIASVLSVASAASCTSDNAAPWPYTPGDGGGSDDCNGDAECLALQAEGECNALALIDEGDVICAKARRLRRRVHRRAVDLDCSGNEMCLFFTDDSLLCLDETTGEYHDDVGGSGNAFTGVYTGPDGDTITVTGTAIDDTAGPTATPTAGGSDEEDGSGGSTAASTLATRTVGDEDESTPTAAAAGSGSGSGSDSSATETSAGVGATHGALLAAAAVPLLAAML